MATVNEELFDALVRHQIYLLRLSGHIRNRIYRLLDATEADIADKIRSRLLGTNGLDTPASVRKMEALLASIRKTRLTAWSQVNEAWLEDLQDLASNEAVLMAGVTRTVAPVILDLVLPSPALLRSIATTNPFEGRTMRQWASTIAADDLRRIENAVRVGMVQGESSAAIAQRVVGSAALRGVDGVTQITRNSAQAITRTAVNHISNQARREFIHANSDLFDEEQYVATLDARTTPVCRANDGKRFPIGKGPLPPLHFQCRSLRVPVIDGDALGERPAKPVTEKQLLKEFSAQRGFPAPTKRMDLPHGTKTAYDQFARGRIRELTGRVPAKTTYQGWLTKQSASFQDEVLGKTRAQLFRKGKLPLDRFVNRAGDEIPLSRLAKMEADSFRAAGLDPEDFL
jgi:SPP1 gp7 family putative phage head morphogenesis protein